MSDKIKVTIDRSKWRTGCFREGIATGQGYTKLLNKEGFMCCLGFVCEAAGVHSDDLLQVENPYELGVDVPELTEWLHGHVYDDSELSLSAIEINDDPDLRASEKEQKLLELFKDSPYELEFVGEYSFMPSDVPGGSVK